MRQLLLAAGLLLVVSACTGGEFYRTVKLSPDETAGTSIVTDARLRLISNIKPGVASRPGLVDPKQLICVEPSPDVAVAAANSMGASAGIAGRGSFAITGATAEGLAQIAERTTAIQAILRQGYQACIDYMNGAISGTTYSLRQSRLDDLLVTLVLAEDAAGAFGRAGAKIGTKADASAEAAASLLPSIKEGVDQANKDINDKQKDVDQKKAALDQAEKDLAAAPTDAALIKKRDDARASYNQAVAERDAALRRSTGLTEAAAKASAGVTEVAGIGGITAKPDPEIAKTIGKMQENFVNKDVEQAYISTCLTELGLWKKRDPEDDDLRRLAFGRLESATKRDVEGTEDLPGQDVEDYFLATQIGLETRLTKHCEENLSTFLIRAQTNQHNRKVLEMELQAELAARDAEASAQLGAGVHPSYNLNIAKNASTSLDAAKASLSAKTVPATTVESQKAERQALIDRQRAALAEADAIIKRNAELLAGAPAKASSIESDFTRLVADVRRTGTEADRDNWEREFAIQQSQAALLADQLDAYSGAAERARAEIAAVVQMIDSLPK